MYKIIADKLAHILFNEEKFAKYLEKQLRKVLLNVLKFIRKVADKTKNPRLHEAAIELERKLRELGLL